MSTKKKPGQTEIPKPENPEVTPDIVPNDPTGPFEEPEIVPEDEPGGTSYSNIRNTNIYGLLLTAKVDRLLRSTFLYITIYVTLIFSTMIA